MAEDFCFFNKEILIIKPPKKSPVLLRTIVVIFAILCGVYICSICVKQSNAQLKNEFLSIEVIEFERRYRDYGSDKSQIPYLHCPKPETFSRSECACNPVQFFAILSMQRSGSGWFETLLNSHINVSSNGEIFFVKDRRDDMSSIIQTSGRVYNLDWLSSASKNHCSAAVGFKWMLNQCLLANSYDRHAKLLNGTHKSHMHSPEEKLVEVQEFLRLPVMNLTSRQVKIHKGPLSEHIKNWDDVNKTLQGTTYESFLYTGF